MKWIVLRINPEPWAIGAATIGRKNGKLFATVGRNQQLYNYQQAVREEIGKVKPLLGKIHIRCFFWRRLDNNAQGADATNLLKSTEDALQGLLFPNDRENVHVEGIIVAQSPFIHGAVVLAIEEEAKSVPKAVADIPQRILDSLQVDAPAINPTDLRWPPVNGPDIF